ncbi:MAG TPA: putative Ig domain-containing protein, partial [Thermomicrobiales bacterium]|nr:putative Ig domain-containing protein [Thermomicrobiales bacterium]
AGTGGTHQLTLTAHNGIGSDATQSFTLTVDEAPAVTSANATTFIVGTAGTFTVTTGGSPTPTLTESGALPASVTFTDNGNGTATLAGTPAPGTGGTYTLTLTAHNGVGADATQSFTLTVDEAPVVTADPLSQTVCLGATVGFTAAASGFPVPTVQWQVSTDGGQTFTDIGGATSPTYTIAATTFSERGNYYRAVFTNSVGSATSARALLIVNSPPAITTQPTSQTVTAGQAVSFFSAASGFPVPTAVQWQVSADNGATWTDIPGATHPTLTFTTAGTDNGHQYRAVYTNTCGTATTNAATLVVQGTPVVTTQPASQSANAGQRVTFTAAASGNPAPTVQWQASSDNGATWTSIPGATATTLTVLAAPPVNGNQYRAVFTNVVGSATTDAATLTVNTGAGYSGWVSLGGRLTGTAPAAVTYNGALYVFARGTDFALYVRHSADGATYTPWQRLGGLIDSAPTAAVHDGTLYVFVRGTDNALYETHTGDGATYTPWRRLGGVLTSAPAATTFQGRLVVFAAGADHALYVTSSADGVAYGPWQNLGGRLPDAQADPAALVVSGHGLYAYVRGGDNGLYVTQTTDGVAYSGWRSLGGVLTSGPAAASVNGTLVILARGSDLALYERRSTDGGATYTDWRSLGGILTTAPAATAFQGQVYVFAAGTDDALYTQHTR